MEGIEDAPAFKSLGLLAVTFDDYLRRDIDDRAHHRRPARLTGKILGLLHAPPGSAHKSTAFRDEFDAPDYYFAHSALVGRQLFERSGIE